MNAHMPVFHAFHEEDGKEQAKQGLVLKLANFLNWIVAFTEVSRVVPNHNFPNRSKCWTPWVETCARMTLIR